MPREKRRQTYTFDKTQEYGFKDKSSMLRMAIDQLKKIIELEQLKQSANLYNEVYSEDEDLKELTESAISGWPE
jgi:hypothetical protein